MKLINIFNLAIAVLFSIQTGFANQNEAEFKKYKENWTLAADGSQEYNCHKEVTIFTYTAMHSAYGETVIAYNPLYQKLKINDSYTVQKDGTIIKTPANAFVEVLPRKAAGMPAYSHLKEMVVVHTGLELGATIVLDYSILSKPGYLSDIDICKQLQQSSPIREYEISFTFPKNKTPHYAIIGRNAKPIKSVKNNCNTVTWKFKNLPAISRAPQISLQNEDIPGILFNTYNSNAEALQKVYRQFNPATDFNKLVATVTKNAQNKTEKFNAIYDFVMQNIVACPLSFEAAGYRIRSADEVINSVYATEVEKINILNGMLNAAGIEAHPAAAYYINTEPDNCGLNAVGKWFVAANCDGHTLYVDALSKNPAAASANFVIINGDKKDNPNVTKTIKYSADIKYRNNVAEANVIADFSNEFMPNSVIKAGNFLELDNKPAVKHDLHSTCFEGKTPVQSTSKANFVFLRLPETNVGLDTYKYANYNSTRNVNLLLPCLFEEQYTYTITLPDNLIYNSPDVNKKITNSTGKISIVIRQEKGKIVVERSVSIDKKLISPKEYSDFRQLMIEWNDPNLKQIVLKNIVH